jgi:hypothetical protein
MLPIPAPVPWPDTGTLSTIAGIIAAFSVSMIFFRVQREIQMHGDGEINWVPWADRLLLLSSFLSLICVLLPLVAAHPSSWAYQRLPGPACAATVVLVAAYPAAILAHYRFILGCGREGERDNPEPAERWIVWFALASSLATAAWSYPLHAL